MQGREDIPLNAKGLAQAAAVAEYLAQTPWDVIISSPLQRARQTAEVIGQRLGIQEIIEDPCFMERDYGKGSGLTLAERKARYPDRQYEGMENWDILCSRMMNGLDRYVKDCIGRNIIIVSHGSAINSVLATLSSGKIGTGKTRLANACVNILRYGEGSYTIELYNQTAEYLLRE